MLLQLRRRADDPAELPHPDRLFVLSEKFRRRSIVADRPIAEEPILVPANGEDQPTRRGWTPTQHVNAKTAGTRVGFDGSSRVGQFEADGNAAARRNEPVLHRHVVRMHRPRHFGNEEAPTRDSCPVWTPCRTMSGHANVLPSGE